MPIAQPAPTVTLEGIELRVLHLPLVSPFTTSFGTETVREVIVARALTADGDGWGEIVTQESPLYSSEYTQGAWDVSLRFLIPALLDRHTLAPEDVASVLDPPSASCDTTRRRSKFMLAPDVIATTLPVTPLAWQ